MSFFKRHPEKKGTNVTKARKALASTSHTGIATRAIPAAFASPATSSGAHGSSASSHRTRRALFTITALALLLALLIATTSALASEGLTSSFGGTGTLGGKLTGAGGDAVNNTGAGSVPIGSVYVADTTNNRIDQFKENGEFIRAWGYSVVSGGAEGTGTIANASTSVESVVTTKKAFLVGQTITGEGIPAATTITAVTSGVGAASKLTLSQAATESKAGDVLRVAEGTGNVAANAKQTVTVPAAATSGNFKLKFKTTSPTLEETTANIPFNATAVEVENALAALTNIVGSGNIAVSLNAGGNAGGGASPGGPWTVEFKGTRFADTKVETLVQTAGSPNLSSGTVSIAIAQEGAGAAEVCTEASSCLPGAKVALGGGMSGPISVAVNQETGNVYVFDNGYFRIDEFSAAGAFIRAWGADVVQSGPDQADEVRAFTVTATGGTYSLSFGGKATGATGTGNTTQNSTTVNLTSTTGTFVAGEAIEGSGIPAGTTIEAVTASTLTLSQAATAEGNASLTAALPFNAPASTLEKALQALSTVGSGNLAVSGGPGNEVGAHPYVITFTGSLGGAVQGTITSTPTGLTGTAAFTKMHSGATGFEVCTAANGDVCKTGVGSGGDSGLGGGFGGATAPQDSLAVNPTTGSLVVVDSNIVSGGLRIDEFASAGAFVRAFGFGVVASGPDLKTGTVFDACVEADGDVCKAGSSGSGVGQIGAANVPDFIAVDSTGAIYVTDSPNSRVEKFVTGATPAEVTPSVFAASQLSGSPAPTALAIEPNANGDRLLVVKPISSPSESRVLEFDSAGDLIATHYAGLGLPAATGLAYDSASSSLYYSTKAGNAVLAANSIGALSFAPGVPLLATPTVSEATSVTTRSATLHGTVDPNGFDTTYQFEVSADGGADWAKYPANPVDVGSGTSAVAVSQHVQGLQPHAGYLVRLAAKDAAGTATSANATFSTGPEPPDVSQVVASPVTATSAKLTAYINPNNSPTSYRFEYGTTTTYGSQAPEFEPFIGTGGQPLPVKVTISGLQPETTYHFRLVASNGNPGGSGVGTTESPDEEFTTLATSCPNEQRRGESELNPATGQRYSAELPECRAYEMVSPPYKEGSSVLPATGQFFFSVDASDSSRLIEENLGLYEGQGNPDQSTTIYEIARTASGWKSTPLDPPATEFSGGNSQVFAPELSGRGGLNPLDAYPGATLWDATPSHGPDAGIYSEYIRNPDGTYSRIGPELGSQSLVGTSNDLSHLVFTKGGALYEYVGAGHTGVGSDVATSLGVDNVGAQITTCGSGLTEGQGFLNNAVSAQGSTVFLTANAGTCSGGNGPAVNQLYARVGSEPKTATMVNVAAPGPTCANDACGVTAAPSFQGASDDGSVVIFTTTQALSPSDHDSGLDLYECRGLPGDSGSQPAPKSPVNPCPELLPISVTGTSASSGLQGLVALSQDGSHVYYVATGVVTSAPNSQGQEAEAGGDNLYVTEPDPVHPGQLKTAFIATLSAADSVDWTGHTDNRPAQASIDGRYLVFSSVADLTPDDTSSVAQLFRYDADTEQLIRVSVGQNGYNNNGNTNANPAEIPTQVDLGPAAYLTNLVIAGNGAVAFTTHQALAPNASTGGSGTCGMVGNIVPSTARLCNTYVYRDGNVSLINNGEGLIGQSKSTLLFGLSTSGNDVFLTSSSRLVRQDTDTTYDIYDARVDGGFAAPEIVTPCNPLEDGSCQGPPLPAPAAAGNPATPGFSGPGNESAPAPKKKQKTHKKKQKAGKNHKKPHRHHARRAGNERGGRK